MTTKLGDLLLDDETALAVSVWLDGLVEARRRAIRKAQQEEEKEERESIWCDRLIVIAQAAADRHGPMEDMDPYEQAKAACASWEAQAGRLDVGDYFAMDDDYRELYHDSYCNRIREIERSRTS